MIKTKSIFQPPDPLDGIRVLITQGSVSDRLRKPRFDLHLPELGPSYNLLRDYKGWGGKSPISWEEYEERFVAEMSSGRSREVIKELAKWSVEGTTFTLLCYEKEQNPRCHRHIVKRLILSTEDGLREKLSRKVF